MNGNVARCRVGDKKIILWDDLLPGFGLRFLPSGTKSWIVQYEERGIQRYRTLGRVADLDAGSARKRARAILAKVCLDVLPEAPERVSRQGKAPVLFADYVERFWNDYALHWKPNTQKRSRAAIRRDLVPVFGAMPIADIARPDIMRWRDDLVRQPGNYNRAVPVLSIMLGYAEQLGLRPKGSNPCRGIPRYKVRKHERFLSAREHCRLSVMQSRAVSRRTGYAGMSMRKSRSAPSTTSGSGFARTRAFRVSVFTIFATALPVLRWPCPKPCRW
ncbi:MAG: integrase arm-type DNA-binding domain-containing protein [Pacificimonas sp.]